MQEFLQSAIGGSWVVLTVLDSLISLNMASLIKGTVFPGSLAGLVYAAESMIPSVMLA